MTSINIKENVSLADHCTLRIGGEARFFTKVQNKSELEQTVQWVQDNGHKLFVLGGGSNVVFTDKGFDGLVVKNEISGFEAVESSGDKKLKIGAGENWDEVVAQTVAMGLSGVEALSLIPGTVGAAPVQNIGAYGQELSDTFVELEAFDRQTNQFVTLDKDDCQFSYRDSIFKNPPERRYIICNITLQLSKDWMQSPFYDSLEEYLNQHHITEYSPANIRQAVINIRQSKLPDPQKVPNVGSFFKNPIVSKKKAQSLKSKYSSMNTYQVNKRQVKIPAGWLLEQAGLKDYCQFNLCTYQKHALVIINPNQANYQDLIKFTQHITGKIKQQFGITLEQEPETILA